MLFNIDDDVYKLVEIVNANLYASDIRWKNYYLLHILQILQINKAFIM